MPDLFGWYTPPTTGSPGGSNYNVGLVSFADDPEQVKASRRLLEQAGLWNPSWDTWANFQAEGDSSAVAPPVPDLSSLAGYKVGHGDFGGGNKLIGLVGPDGQTILDTPYTYEEPSFGESLAQGALFVGSAALGMNALFNPAGIGGLFGGGSGAGAVAPLEVPSAGWQSAGMPGIASPSATLGATAVPAAASSIVGPGISAGAAGAAGTGLYGTATTLPAATSLATTGLGAAGAAAPAAFSWDTALKSLANGGARSVFDIASGLYGLNLAGKARDASDPFAQYRAGYGQQLAALEANPSSITSRPGWRAGLEGVDRQMAARGYYGSGNMDVARTRYAGDFYTQEANRLAGLAGAGQSPGAGQYQSAQLAGQSLASIGYGLAPWLGGRPS